MVVAWKIPDCLKASALLVFLGHPIVHSFLPDPCFFLPPCAWVVVVWKIPGCLETSSPHVLHRNPISSHNSGNCTTKRSISRLPQFQPESQVQDDRNRCLLPNPGNLMDFYCRVQKAVEAGRLWLGRQGSTVPDNFLPGTPPREPCGACGPAFPTREPHHDVRLPPALLVLVLHLPRCKTCIL